MSTKEIQPGKIMTYSNGGSAISSGDVVVLTNQIGVAEVDIAASTGTGSVSLEGVYQLAKVTGTAFTQGDLLFWDGSNHYLTKTATGNTWAGQCFESAASGDSTCLVRLEPMPKQSTVITALGQTISGTYSQSEVQAISTKVDAIIAALKVAGLMANS